MVFSMLFYEKFVKFLFGGEKARLAFVKFMVTLVNVFLFDELMNYLDILSKEMFENVICWFDGIVIVILYDCYFLW